MVQDRGTSQIMSNFAATLVVLLLLLNAAVFSSARLVVEDFLSGTQLRRSLSESSEPRTVAVDLMHVDHVDSPYMQPNLTSLQRAQNAVKKSNQRLKYFSSKIVGEKKRIGVNHVLSSPVFSEQASYVMQISAGTPTRTFSATMDTGSDLVWLQCSPCTDCFTSPDPLFDPTASSSYTSLDCTETFCTYLPVDDPYPACSVDNTCLYSYTYGDQSSTTGSMAYETFTFTSTDGLLQSFSEVAFGCGTDNSGLFGTVNGLVGLGNGPLSLVSQLGTTVGGVWEPYVTVFSYCLVDYAAAATTTSPLLLGSAGSIALTYTPLITNLINPTFYYVNLVGITVGAQPISYPSDTFTIDPTTGVGGLILDSGTTLTYLYDAAYTPLVNAIASLISYPLYSVSGFDLCYDTSSAVTPVFPEVVFQFDGVDLPMPSNNIFLPVDTQSIVYCLFLSSAGVSLGISIFGNVQQQNFQVAYDIANGQVGFAPTSC